MLNSFNAASGTQQTSSNNTTQGHPTKYIPTTPTNTSPTLSTAIEINANYNFRDKDKWPVDYSCLQKSHLPTHSHRKEPVKSYTRPR